MFPRARRGSISHRNLRDSHTPKLRSGRGGAFAAARVAATAPPALHLHVDVLNQVFTCEVHRPHQARTPKPSATRPMPDPMPPPPGPHNGFTLALNPALAPSLARTTSSARWRSRPT